MQSQQIPLILWSWPVQQCAGPATELWETVKNQVGLQRREYLQCSAFCHIPDVPPAPPGDWMQSLSRAQHWFVSQGSLTYQHSDNPLPLFWISGIASRCHTQTENQFI